jgi:multimeric flavodoxin WrbA
MQTQKKITRREAIKYAGAAIAGSSITLGVNQLFSNNQKPVLENTNKLPSDRQTMKVLLLNGSPHEKGCTFTALNEIADTLINHGIESEILWLGKNPVSGCLGCGACKKSDECIIQDSVNQLLSQLDNYDGFVFGSPVHYAAASGFITPFLDRLFYAGGKQFYGKPGAAIVSCRRAGSTAAFEQLNKYFTISNMPIISSQYWNMVHGNTPDEVRQDLEGMQIMRTLGQNMAWLLKCIDLGKKNGVTLPSYEKRVSTNFIR